MTAKIKLNIQFGVRELVDRQLVRIRTGDEAADMIIIDLENRLNKSADRIEELKLLAAPNVPEDVREAMILAIMKFPLCVPTYPRTDTLERETAEKMIDAAMLARAYKLEAK